MDKIMDHRKYPEGLRSKPESELLYTIEDAKAAISANPENPNNSYYQDEICYCVNELNRRKTKSPK